MGCPAISGAAAATSASMRPSAPPPGECDMNYHHTRNSPVITNVSRRRLLKGLAASGGLVLAAQYPALAAPSFDPTGAVARPNKPVSDTKVFGSIPPYGTVTTVAARAEMS